MLCTGLYNGGKIFRRADHVDPVDEGAGGAAFVAAVLHVPDQMVIHIRSEHPGRKKNIVAYAEGGVLIGGAAAVTPIRGRINGAQTVIAKKDLGRVEKIRLPGDSLRAFTCQGLLNIAVDIFLVKAIQRGKLLVMIGKDLCHACGKVDSVLLRRAEGVILGGLVHRVKAGDRLVALIHKAGADHEAAQIDDLPASVLVPDEPRIGIRVGSGGVDLARIDHGVEGIADVPQDRIIVIAFAQTGERQRLARAVFKAAGC